MTRMGKEKLEREGRLHVVLEVNTVASCFPQHNNLLSHKANTVDLCLHSIVIAGLLLDAHLLIILSDLLFRRVHLKVSKQTIRLTK